jgi:hypothetical protein
MSQFEFIFVLISIIVGLALAQLMSGLARPPRDSHGKTDVAHFAFSAATTLLLVTVWWATFRWQKYADWTFLEFLLLFSYVSLFYVMAVILTPSRTSDIPEFRQIRLKFYAVFICYCLVEPVVMYVRDGAITPWYYLPMIIHVIVLSSLGMLLRKDKFDRLFALWLCLVNLSWPLIARFTG